MTPWFHHNPARFILATLALGVCFAAPTGGQEAGWLPTPGTHAWARFGLRAWKEVRIQTFAYDEDEQEVRSSTAVARTRVINIGRRSFSLCVTTTVEIAGREFSPAPQEFTKELAPAVESSKVLGEEMVTVGGHQYPAQVIQLVTKSGTRREKSNIHYCATTTPQTLKRVSTSVDSQTPGITTSTTVTVTELGKMVDILGEKECTWLVTTVIKKDDRTVTIREVHCQDVPGELVSQVTEERNAAGKLVSRKELELMGFGQGRLRRLFRRGR